MYLSPGVAPPTYTRHRRHLALTTAAASRSGATLSLSFLPLTQPPPFLHLPSVSIFLLPFAFVQTSLRRGGLPFPHTYTCNNDVQHPRTSLHAAFTFPCVLTHVYFSPLSSPSSSPLSCAWRSSSIAFTGHQRIPTTWRPNPVESSRRIASRRFFALSPTSPLAYCFREFDEILPRDANGPPCTFFDSTVGHSELN